MPDLAPVCTTAGIARAWEELKPLTRHGPCRNCERLHGALVEFRRVLESCTGSAETGRLLAALSDVRRTSELHQPLGCQPCSTEAVLRASMESPEPSR